MFNFDSAFFSPLARVFAKLRHDQNLRAKFLDSPRTTLYEFAQDLGVAELLNEPYGHLLVEYLSNMSPETIEAIVNSDVELNPDGIFSFFQGNALSAIVNGGSVQSHPAKLEDTDETSPSNISNIEWDSSDHSVLVSFGPCDVPMIFNLLDQQSNEKLSILDSLRASCDYLGPCAWSPSKAQIVVANGLLLHWIDWPSLSISDTVNAHGPEADNISSYEPECGITSLQFDKTGRWLYSLDSRAISVWCAESKQIVRCVEIEPTEFLGHSAHLSPSENLIAHVVDERSLEIRDALSLDLLSTFPGDGMTSSISWAPSGTEIAWISYYGRVEVIDLTTAKRRSLKGLKPINSCIDWSSGGAIAIETREHGICVIDPPTGTLLTASGFQGDLSLAPAESRILKWSHDGQRVAVSLVDWAWKVWTPIITLSKHASKD